MHLSLTVDTVITHVAELMRPVPRRQNTAWVEWSNRLPLSPFLVWLAGYVANDLCKSKPGRMTPAEWADLVGTNSTNMMQRDAERFLRQTYFAYRPFCPHFQRMLLVFRHLVQSRIRRRFHVELVK